MNSFLRRMGVPADWEINDVFGLEEELLSMLPQPVLALLLLFPISEKASGTYLSNLQQWRTQDLLEGAGSLSFEIICFWQFLIEYSHYRKLQQILNLKKHLNILVAVHIRGVLYQYSMSVSFFNFLEFQ